MILHDKILALREMGLGYSAIAVRLNVNLYPEWDGDRECYEESILGCAHRHGSLDAEWTDRMRDHLYPRPLPTKVRQRAKAPPSPAADVVRDSTGTKASADKPARSAEAAPHRPRGGKRRKVRVADRRAVRKG